MKKYILNRVKNILGPRVEGKFLAFFVDDFGSIRVRNSASKENLINAGIQSNSIYLNDTIASEEDISALYDVLMKFQDQAGNHACFTPFVIVANPDFEKIRESGFTEYYREPFTKTFERYGNGYGNLLKLWKEGMSKKIFSPAFHGTEHINVKKWMKALQAGHKSTMLGFENYSVCIPTFPGESEVSGLVKAYDIETSEDIGILLDGLHEGINIYQNKFQRFPRLFTPGAGTYSPMMEDGLHKLGIEYIDTSRSARQPMGNGKYVKKFHYLGERNTIGQHFIIRNCSFEPIKTGDAAISVCMKQIEAAFAMHKPAIISSHRLNFIGHFYPRTRQENLARLKILIENIVKRWPDVMFVDGDRICDMIL